jgi:electron transfer flavoprotein alpha subunit
MPVLVVAEHDNVSIQGATLNTVTAAVMCGGDVHVLVAGASAAPAAQAAARIPGVAKILHADAPPLEHGLAENLAAQVLAHARNYTHVLFPATASGKNVAPRVAAKLDVAAVSDVITIVAPDTFDRPIYAGNAVATVLCEEPVKVLTVRTTAFDPAPSNGGDAPVDAVPAVAESGKSRFVAQEIAKSDRPELTAARTVVSGGRALGSSESSTKS